MNRDLAGPVRANALLHKVAIEEACSAGVERYSFGGGRLGSAGSSLVRFKEGFGAQRVDLSVRLLERVPMISAADSARGIVRRGIGALRR
jgi:hypothetical protein